MVSERKIFQIIAAAFSPIIIVAAAVFSEHIIGMMDASDKLDAGMIAINRGLVSDPAAPFGGVKQSGLGREGAHHGILEFMEAKYIAVDW